MDPSIPRPSARGGRSVTPQRAGHPFAYASPFVCLAALLAEGDPRPWLEASARQQHGQGHGQYDDQRINKCGTFCSTGLVPGAPTGRRFSQPAAKPWGGGWRGRVFRPNGPMVPEAAEKGWPVGPANALSVPPAPQGCAPGLRERLGLRPARAVIETTMRCGRPCCHLIEDHGGGCGPPSGPDRSARTPRTAPRTWRLAPGGDRSCGPAW